MAIKVTGLLRLENSAIIDSPTVKIIPILGYKGELRFNAVISKGEQDFFHVFKDFEKSNLLNDGVSNIYDQIVSQGEQAIINYFLEIEENSQNEYEII